MVQHAVLKQAQKGGEVDPSPPSEGRMVDLFGQLVAETVSEDSGAFLRLVRQECGE